MIGPDKQYIEQIRAQIMAELRAMNAELAAISQAVQKKRRRKAK
jgi:hypothetical protein